MIILEKMSIGMDIVDVDRFRKIPYNKKPNFYRKIFLPSEIKYCLRFKNQHEHFAGKFAIKEAVQKAIKETISPLDVETSHVDSKPTVKLRGKLADKYLLITSVSHDKNIAIAVVVSERIKIK